MIFLVLPLMKLPITYLMSKKYTPIAADSHSCKREYVGFLFVFLLCPQLSSDTCDKCDCLRKKNSRGPGVGHLTCLLGLDFTVVNISYLNVLEMAETYGVSRNKSVLVAVGTSFYRQLFSSPIFPLIKFVLRFFQFLLFLFLLS